LRVTFVVLQILVSHLNPLSYISFFLIRIWRPFFYRAEKSKHLVISIGNLTVGGTGKTPFCLWLVNHLKKKYPVSIINKNYRALGRIPHEVKGLGLEALAHSGDEALLYKSYFSEKLSVFSGPRKFETLKMLNKQLENPRIIVVDDGFQHTQLLPQLSILLIDLSDWWMWGVVPFGRAREWFWSIRMADAIIITKSHEIDQVSKYSLLRLIRLISKKQTPILEATYSTTWPQIEPDCEIILVSGLANNEAFFEGARKQYSNQIKGEFGFSDHCPFDQDTLKPVFRILNNNEKQVVLVTEKDAVKLRILYPNLPLKVTQMKVEVTNDELLWGVIFSQNNPVL